MYLARDQPHGNGLSESRSAVDEDVIRNEQAETTGSQQLQSRLQPQSSPRPQPLITTSSIHTRDRETDLMQQHSSTWRLREEDDEDDNDDENEEEEQPDNNFFTATERHAPPRVILVGWDKFRTKMLLFLIVCLLIWACVFFPLLST